MFRLTLAFAATSVLFAACTTKHEVYRTFSGPGISHVILRASKATDATFVNLPPAHVPTVGIMGVPYVHAGNRFQPLRYAPEASLRRPRPDFVARQFGDTLVISIKNELQYPDSEYYMDVIPLWIYLPINIDIVREPHPVTEHGLPDLSPPRRPNI